MSTPQIILFAREGFLPEESAILSALKAAGLKCQVARSLPEMIALAEDAPPDGTIFIVHFESTLHGPDDLMMNGYDEFLHTYGRLRMKQAMACILMNPRDIGFGYGDL